MSRVRVAGAHIAERYCVLYTFVMLAIYSFLSWIKLSYHMLMLCRAVMILTDQVD